jgi:hypothetical protein
MVSARVLSEYVIVLYACNVKLMLLWCLRVSSGST